MAGSVARIACATVDGYELPTIVGRVQYEHQHTPRVRLQLAVGTSRHGSIQTAAPCSDDKLSNAIRGVGGSGRILRRKPLIQVVVSVDDDIDLELVERAPDVLHRTVAAVGSGAEE